MNEGKPNQHRGRCWRCGRMLEQGEGRLVNVEANGEFRRKPVCADGCPPQDSDNGRSSEQRAFAARAAEMESQRAPEPTPEEMALRTTVGQQWLAYWWLRGSRPKPNSVTMGQLDEMLGDADLEEMDRQVGFHRRLILAGPSIHESEWKRARIAQAEEIA